MNKAISAALSLVALASTVLIQPQSASANDIERILGRVMGGSTGLNGGVNQVQIQTNVQTGLANLQSQLQTGINNGSITASEAASINAELARVTAMHNSFLYGGYTNDEVSQVLSSFTQLNSMIASATAGGYSGSIGTLPYGNYGNYGNHNYGNYGNHNYGNSAYFGDYNSVISLRSSVQSRINAGVANGSLTRAEADQLRWELTQISRQINRRQMAGNLNNNPIVRRLSNLDSRLDQMMNNNRYAGRANNWWY